MNQPPRSGFARLALTAIAALGAASILTACTSPTPSGPSASSGPSVPPAVAEASLDGLRIFMTNDDSMQAANERNSDGLGLYELRRALCEAGADVVVIAPWAVQSGRGTAVTNSGTFTAAESAAMPSGYESDCASAPSSGALYGLCLGDGSCGPDSPSATPADTVKFAMRGGLAALVGWDERPDLVISGSNSGENLASSVNDSGTIAAAVAAVEHRVPAVAFSTGGDSGSFPVANYRATSEWGVAFLRELMSRRMLQQHHFAISVNYPNASADRPVKKAEFVEVGTAAFAYHYYPQAGERQFDIKLRVCEGVDLCEESKANADWVKVYQEGAIGVGAIAPDRSYGTEIHAEADLAALRAFVAEAAPAPIS